MRLPDGGNVAARQAVQGSAPCARTEVTGRWLRIAADSPCLDDSSRGDVDDVLPKRHGPSDVAQHGLPVHRDSFRL